MNTRQAIAGRIVVGVDGSPSSRAALAWAVQQAEVTGASIDAINAWHFPVIASGYGWVPVSVLDEPDDFAAIAARSLTEAISETVGRDCPVKISTTVQEGIAAQVLLEAANGADLLVVGSRRHGGFPRAPVGPG